jgi:hypothetical protein
MAASTQSFQSTKTEREPLRKWLDVLYAMLFGALVITLIKSEWPVEILRTYRFTEDWRGAFAPLVIVLFIVCFATVYLIEQFYSRLSKLQWGETLNESQQFATLTTWGIRAVAVIWLLSTYQLQTTGPFTKMFLIWLVVGAIALLIAKRRYQK